MSANRLKLNADKTELLWAGSRHGPAMLESAGPSLRLRTETVVVTDQVRVFDNDVNLSLDKHVANVCATCFYWLRQLRRVRRSLDAEYAAGRRFCDVTRGLLQRHSRWGIHVCTHKLQRVMNAAARVVSDTRKYDRGLHDELHCGLA